MSSQDRDGGFQGYWENIEEGKNDFENGDKITLSIDGKLVSLRKNVRMNGKKIADKTWVLTAYDTSASDGSSAITATNKGKAAPATDENRGKGTNNPSNGQEKEKETAQSVENKGKSQTPQGKAQP